MNFTKFFKVVIPALLLAMASFSGCENNLGTVGGTPTATNTIVNDNSSWATLAYGLGAWDIPCCVETQYVYFAGDSIVENHSYKKVFSCDDQLHENIKFEGLMREESQKTYFIPDNSNKEYLLYDFSLEEGMTFNYVEPQVLPEYEYNISYYIKTVDFVEIDGVQLKRIQLSNPPPDDDYINVTWIETIGSLTGLFEPCGIIMNGGNIALLCYYQNNELIYKNPSYSECYYDNADELQNELNSNNLQK